MLQKILSIRKAVQKAWDVIAFYIPLFELIVRFLDLLREDEDEIEGVFDEEEKQALIDIMLELYDVIDEVIDEDEDSIPISKETFKKHLSNFIDIILKVKNIFANSSQ